MSMGPTDFVRITPEEFLRRHPESKHTLEELRGIAEEPEETCGCCETMPIWKFGQCGMCFSCTTGEADASDDYELVPSASMRSTPRKPRTRKAEVAAQ